MQKPTPTPRQRPMPQMIPSSSASLAHQWLYSEAQLYYTPSSKEGIPWSVEAHRRACAARMISKLGGILKVTQITIATAAVYMHRFYMRESLKEFDHEDIAPTAFFLACKVEETPRKLRDVVEHTMRLRRADIRRKREEKGKIGIQIPFSEFEGDMMQRDKAGNELRTKILHHEDRMLQVLCYDLTVHHPYVDVIGKTRKALLVWVQASKKPAPNGSTGPSSPDPSNPSKNVKVNNPPVPTPKGKEKESYQNGRPRQGPNQGLPRAPHHLPQPPRGGQVPPEKGTPSQQKGKGRETNPGQSRGQQQPHVNSGERDRRIKAKGITLGAWGFTNDSYTTPLCILYPPKVIAAAAFHCACAVAPLDPPEGWLDAFDCAREAEKVQAAMRKIWHQYELVSDQYIRTVVKDLAPAADASASAMHFPTEVPSMNGALSPHTIVEGVSEAQTSSTLARDQAQVPQPNENHEGLAEMPVPSTGPQDRPEEEGRKRVEEQVRMKVEDSQAQDLELRTRPDNNSTNHHPPPPLLENDPVPPPPPSNGIHSPSLKRKTFTNGEAIPRSPSKKMRTDLGSLGVEAD